MKEPNPCTSLKIARNAKAVADAPVKPGSITNTSPINTSPGVDTLLANSLLNKTGSIEQMEARGGAEVAAQRERLPTDRLNREQAEKIGIQVHEVDENDPIWTRVTLPKGWIIQRTDHDMWNKLVDDQGRERASIFYKAAFYDRSAHMNFCQRYHVDCYGDDCSKPPRKEGEPYGDETHRRAIVRDTADDKVLFTTDWLELADPRDWDAEEKIREEADEWLTSNYPDYRDPTAYWD